MSISISRRQILRKTSQVLGASALLQSVASQPAESHELRRKEIRYCLNTSTIRGQELTMPQEIELTARAGYDGIEPWIRKLRTYVESGGTTSDLRKQIEDWGLTVESAIGFATWIVDDDEARAEGFENMKRDMELVRAIGGSRIAAPPVGATNQSDLNLFRAAERYHDLLELGRQTGVTPQLELWGFSKSLSRLGELMFVAVEAGHPDACLLPDVYHIYKGGSEFAGLRLIDGASIQVMHLNDYPGHISREKIGDADRVYPGDGDAPLLQIISDLRRVGFSGTFSLELFNREYWKQDASEVAMTGLAKMKAVVAAAHA